MLPVLASTTAAAMPRGITSPSAGTRVPCTPPSPALPATMTPMCLVQQPNGGAARRLTATPHTRNVPSRRQQCHLPLPRARLQPISASLHSPPDTESTGNFQKERSPQELASLSEASGPIELPPVDLGADVDLYGETSANPLQTAGSLILTGALTLLLARTFRRRLAKAKEERLRSQVVERLSPKQEELAKAKADLKQISNMEPDVKKGPPSPLSALGGAVVAGALSYVAYNFVTGVDETFAGQNVSDNYTVRQITITIRTIISGLGWLATGVFGANSLGLTLFGIQIALGMDEDTRKARERVETAAENSAVKDENKAE